MKKALIIPLLALSICINAFFAFKRLYGNRYVAAAPSDWSVTWNKQKRDLFSGVKIDSGDIVFVGDSHIERFLLNDFYPGKKIRNRGIGSNTTDQVIARLPDILQRRPSKLFLLIGINDLAMRRPVDSIYDNIVVIADMVKRAGAKINIISLFPSRGADAGLNDETVALNCRLTQYCNYEGVNFIDVFSSLIKDGQLNSELTSDGTHLNSKGYMIWKRQIDKYIN